MRVVRAIAWLTFPLMVGAMCVALSGGFSAHPEIAIVFTLTSALVAVIPASRRAGLIAILLWGTLAISGVALKKYIGPLGFAAFGALTIAAAAVYSVRWAQFLIYPLAYIEASFIGSLGHQTVFEVATVGHLTPDSDSCAAALMPLFLGFLLAVSLIVPLPIMLVFPKLRNAAQYGTKLANPFRTRRGWIWLAAGVAAGAAFGVVAWQDWQINRPCI